MIPTITLHSKSDCTWCDRAREWFTTNAIPFTEIKHDDEAERKQFYETLSPPATTMPQIILEYDGEAMRIGGYGGLMRESAGLLSLFGTNDAITQSDARTAPPTAEDITNRPAYLRQIADELDADAINAPSSQSTIIREAADEIERLRTMTQRA